MKHISRNNHKSLREFTLYGLFLALFVFLGNGSESGNETFKNRIDVLEGEAIEGLDAIQSKLPLLPDFNSKTPSRELCSFLLTKSIKFCELCYNNFVNLKTKDCFRSFLKYKPMLSSFIAKMEDFISEPETLSFL